MSNDDIINGRMLLNELLELVRKNSDITETINVRIKNIDSSIGKIEYTLHGNGVPGLQERVRILEKDILNIRKIEETDTVVKSAISQLKFQWWLLGIIIIFMMGITGKVVSDNVVKEKEPSPITATAPESDTGELVN